MIIRLKSSQKHVHEFPQTIDVRTFIHIVPIDLLGSIDQQTLVTPELAVALLRWIPLQDLGFGSKKEVKKEKQNGVFSIVSHESHKATLIRHYLC